MSKQVFISYHKDDSAPVHHLRNDMTTRGICTWVDTQSIKPGQSKTKSTSQGIIDSQYFIACLSPSFLNCKNCRNQIFLARAYSKKIIPIIISNFTHKQSPYQAVLEAGQLHHYAFKGLEELHWIDFREEDNRFSYEEKFENLIESIQPILKPSPLNSEGIYISYKWHEQDFATLLARDLELSRGLVLFYPFSVKAGDHWREKVYENLRSASHFIVCISPEATQSENILHEVLLARTRNVPFYPVVSERVFNDSELRNALEENINNSSEMSFLNDYQWFTPEPDYPTLLKNLKQALGLVESEKPPKNGIFISYRRADTQAATGRIREKLVERFGAETVFMDVDSIPPGEDFSRYYKDWLTTRSAVVLIMIGEKWTSLRSSSDPSTLPRLFEEKDHVRIEAETALSMSDLRVIPVLIGNAEMPTQEELPDSLHSLTRLNACKVRYDPDFSSDMKHLVAAIAAGS